MEESQLQEPNLLLPNDIENHDFGYGQEESMDIDETDHEDIENHDLGYGQEGSMDINEADHEDIENHDFGYGQEESMDIDEADHVATEQKTSLHKCCSIGLLIERGTILGESLNQVMSHLHLADWEEDVIFEVRVPVRQSGSLVVQEWKPVTDPTDRDRYPEAFDGYEVLLHMKKYSCAYAWFFHFDEELLRQQIEEVLQSFPKAGMAPPNMERVIKILQMSSRFLECIEASLHCINEEETGRKS